MRWFVLDSNSQILAIHAALLHTGKIVYFGGDEHDPVRAKNNVVNHTRLFDCTTLEVLSPPPASPDGDVFCSGHALLSDGRLFVAGGTEFFPQNEPAGQVHGAHFSGLAHAWVFDPSTQQWTRVADMADGRWYPMLVTLATGEVLALCGHPSESDQTRHTNNTPETYAPESNAWRQRSPFGIRLDVLLYPRVHLLPDGDVFCSTPLYPYDEQPSDTVYVNKSLRYHPSSDTWSAVSDTPSDPIYLGYGGTSVLLPLLHALRCRLPSQAHRRG